MQTTRPAVFSERGAVSTPHYLASVVALDILREGGNAVDAAIAAASTLGVVLPHMTGIGGDAFWLVYDAATRTLTALDGSGACGRDVTPARYAGESAVPLRGPRAAITVPGAVRSWTEAHRRFGDLPLERLLEAAIFYAENGCPVSDHLAAWSHTDRELLASDPGAAGIFLPEGSALVVGAQLRQPALAASLRAIARTAGDAFYGPIARSIVAYLRAQAGFLCEDDFDAYRTRWTEPISIKYRCYTAYQVPPPSQGVAGLMILNALDRLDLNALGNGSVAYYRAMVEAVKWAFGYRDAYLCDPAFEAMPLQRLLDPLLAYEMDAGGSRVEVPDRTRAAGEDTVFLATADAAGNAVGLVQSLYFDFGSGVVDPHSGVLLQNRGSSFSLQPGHPNELAPGKRTASTLMAGMLFENDRPYLVYGTQGGEGQPQTQTSIVTRIVDYGFNVQAAIEAPRFLHGAGWGVASRTLLLEAPAGCEVADALERLGYPMERATALSPRLGTAQAIRLKGESRPYFESGADPRGDGLALGY